MAHRISFFPYSEWDSDRGCMAFIALVDGSRVRCLIRAEVLVELAQEDAASPIRTFSEHRESVEELARELIQQGRLDGPELVIRLDDVHHSRATTAPVIDETHALGDHGLDETAAIPIASSDAVANESA
jgi:hypothetical protein